MILSSWLQVSCLDVTNDEDKRDNKLNHMDMKQVLLALIQVFLLFSVVRLLLFKIKVIVFANTGCLLSAAAIFDIIVGIVIGIIIKFPRFASLHSNDVHFAFRKLK